MQRVKYMNDISIQIQNKVIQDIEKYYNTHKFKVRDIDNLLSQCAKMTDELIEYYIIRL
jgi:hypothetical protein